MSTSETELLGELIETSLDMNLGRWFALVNGPDGLKSYTITGYGMYSYWIQNGQLVRRKDDTLPTE